MHSAMVCLLAVPLAAGAERLKEEFRHTHNLGGGGTLQVETFNGGIEVTGSDQASVEISGVKFAETREGLDSIRIEYLPSPNGLRVRATRPEGWRSLDPRARNSGVRFSIRAPRRLTMLSLSAANGGMSVQDIEGDMKAATSNGSIRVDRLGGNVEADASNGKVELNDVGGDVTVRTSNGPVEADGVRGGLQASTSNGHIRAHLHGATRPMRLSTSNASVDLRLDGAPAEMRVSTSNGSITVRVPGAVNASLRATTANGIVQSDFEVRTSGARSKNRLEGPIGDGGPLLHLTTSNGNIRLVRR